MRRLIGFILFIFTCVGWLSAQYTLKTVTANSVIERRGFILQSPPPAYQLFVNVNGVPTAVTSTLTTGAIPTPPAILAKCINAGVIVDCNFSGGSGTFNALTGDATSTSTGGATTVIGLKNVPFCTGFTPTNGQNVQYTTSGSPNPCYTAMAGGGSFPPGNGIPTVNTAGNAWSITYPQIPVENYGAVGYTTKSAAVSGTDSTTAIQNCINALTAGQCLLQALYYKVTAAITIHNQNAVGIRGVTTFVASPTQYGTTSSSTIVTTCASCDIIDVSGTSTSALSVFNKFEDFTLSRSAVATGTAADMYLNFTYGVMMNHVTMNDGVYNLRVHGSGAAGVGGIENSAFQHGYDGVNETTGNFYDVFMDSVDGVANPSFRIRHVGMFGTQALTAVIYGLYIHGASVNDFMGDAIETGTVDYGNVVDYTGSGTLGTGSDIHILNGINDSFKVSGYKVNNLPASTGASVEISGGWATSAAGTGPCIDIESSSGVTVSNVHIGCPVATDAVYVNGSVATSISGNNFLLFDTNGVLVNNSTGVAVNGNVFTGQSSTNAINETTNSVIQNANNTYNGTITNNLTQDSTSIAGMNAGNGFSVFSSTGYNNMSFNGVGGASLKGVASAGTGISDPNMYWNVPTAGIEYHSVNQVAATALYSGGYGLASTGVLGWNGGSAGAPGITPDTGLSRDSAGVVDIGNGTAGDKSGKINTAIANAGTGYQLAGAAPSGHCLVGNGTNYVDSASCGGGSGTVTTVGFTGGIISVANPTTTPAFTVAGTSGGVPYFSSGSTWASSAALTANVLVKGGGAGVAPSNSLTTDNGTTLTYTGTGGDVAVSYTSNGTTAGFIDYAAGSTSAAVAPCNTSASWCVQAPSSLSSNFIETLPTPSTGVILHTVSGSTITDTIITPYQPISNAISTATGGTGISAVTCSTASCTNLRGTYTMTASTVSAGVILTLVWPTTTTAYACSVVQNGGVTSLGLSHSVATATGMTISVAVSVATGSITFDYSCQP